MSIGGKTSNPYFFEQNLTADIAPSRNYAFDTRKNSSGRQLLEYDCFPRCVDNRMARVGTAHANGHRRPHVLCKEVCNFPFALGTKLPANYNRDRHLSFYLF